MKILASEKVKLGMTDRAFKVLYFLSKIPLSVLYWTGLVLNSYPNPQL